MPWTSPAGVTPFAARSRSATTCTSTGIPFTLDDAAYRCAQPPTRSRQDLQRFLARLPSGEGMRNARFGAIGARPRPFNTVRYSEKMLQRSGISVKTVDLSEILGLAAEAWRTMTLGSSANSPKSTPMLATGRCRPRRLSRWQSWES